MWRICDNFIFLSLAVLYAIQIARGQTSETGMADSGISGMLTPLVFSGSGILPDCTCERMIECTIYATFVDDAASIVIPSSRGLRCQIGSTDVPAVVMGEAAMMVGVGSGLGLVAAPASRTFIDNSFNASILSPGSYLFLREIGYIPRLQGFNPCSLQDTTGSGSDILFDFLDLLEVTIVFENNLNQYRTVALNRNQFGQPENMSIQDLDSAQECALTKIVAALRSRFSQQQYFCLSDNIRVTRETVATFVVSCS